MQSLKKTFQQTYKNDNNDKYGKQILFPKLSISK